MAGPEEQIPVLTLAHERPFRLEVLRQVGRHGVLRGGGNIGLEETGNVV